MSGKPATFCFKYYVNLYGSEAFTYLNAPSPTTGSPPPSVLQQNLHPFGREL